jgi:hypothetical protein
MMLLLDQRLAWEFKLFIGLSFFTGECLGG